ncbi:MAG TPA: cell division protein FtsL [Methylotenera sp.]|nr:cell division protein FtsL [Methylotenera sp.]
MTRLNLILYFALMLSALGLVNAQHKSRKLYIELEQMSQAAKQYEQEFGQLQLEQSTWAMHSRVELIAAHTLQMQVPDAKRIQVVSPNSLTVQPAQMPQTNVQPTGQVVPQSGASQ